MIPSGLFRADSSAIARVADSGVAVVLHYDRDFDHIAAVTGQHVQWVVPAGTAD